MWKNTLENLDCILRSPGYAVDQVNTISKFTFVHVILLMILLLHFLFQILYGKILLVVLVKDFYLAKSPRLFSSKVVKGFPSKE